MSATTPASLLRRLGATTTGPIAFRASLLVPARNEKWRRGREGTMLAHVQVSVDSRRRPTWFCIVSCEQTQTRLSGGHIEENGFGLDPVSDLADLPEWLARAAKTLGADFAGGKEASIDVARKLAPMVPRLRAWLFDRGRKDVALATEPSLVEWAGQASPATTTVAAARREAAWVARKLASLGPRPKSDLEKIARRIADNVYGPVFRAALRADDEPFRAALGRELARDDLSGWPLYRRVLGRALVDGADREHVEELHRLVMSFAHLPGMLKKKESFVRSPDVVGAAQRVARGWRAVAKRAPEELSLACFGVLVLLARDGSKTSEAALDAIAAVQAELDPDDYPNADCRDVVERIRAAMRSSGRAKR